MQSIAIIGTGITGLACAYFLSPYYKITLYEKNNYIGGHTNTITINEDSASVPVDTGFIVYNNVTYPNLTRLFKKLDVSVTPTSMSFSVQHVPTGLEFSGAGLNHLFAQRKNLLNLKFWKLLTSINRFNKEAAEEVKNAQYSNISLREYVNERKYGDNFLDYYLVPLSSAIWSAPPSKIIEFPAATLLRFFYNHGLLGLYAYHPWLTVTGGAHSYVKKMVNSFKDCIKINEKVVQVTRKESSVEITTNNGNVALHDKVILACHADQSLDILTSPTQLEYKLLDKFKYQTNVAILHTDSSVMPKTKLSWASWNSCVDFNTEKESTIFVTYWMNSLQSISKKKNYFVSLNREGKIDPTKVIKKITYEHPLFDLAAIEAQTQLPELNRVSRNQNIYFCGSYFKYGFHEDALVSAIDVCNLILGKSVWDLQ